MRISREVEREIESHLGLPLSQLASYSFQYSVGYQPKTSAQFLSPKPLTVVEPKLGPQQRPQPCKDSQPSRPLDKNQNHALPIHSLPVLFPHR